jgi:type I restriction enzyme M protein
MFEGSFRRIDDILRQEAGTSGASDYVEQTSWILFLKYLDDLQKNKSIDAEVVGKKYKQILEDEYMWDNWAAPKTNDGKLDKTKALSGEDLIEFVENRLFSYLRTFKQTADNPRSIEYKIGEIFGEIRNKIHNGHNLREIIDIIDGLEFRTKSELHHLSHLYEQKLKNMGGEGKSSGEYYTPRSLIEAIVNVVDPKAGEKVYDGAVGSAGFLVEAYNHLYTNDLSTSQLRRLQEDSLFGKEKKPLPYILGVMNMILHGIEAPNILHTNTLTENLADIQEKDRFDVIVANPPFGGHERKEVQDNFPIKTGETAYLFLQHFMKMLKAGGRAGIVIKNTFLSNTDNAAVSIRKELLSNFNLHTVIDLPGGVFRASSSVGVKTVILFFEKGASTKKIWYYQLDPGRSLGKTNPLTINDLKEFLTLQKTKADSPKSWTINTKDIDQTTYDLSVKNPTAKEEAALRDPADIIAEIQVLDKQTAEILRIMK